MKKFFAIICAIALVTALAASVLLPAASAATQQEIEAAEKKTKEAKEDVAQAEKEKEAAIAALNTIDNQISTTETQIDILQKQIEQTKNDIALKEEELKVAQEELEKHEEAFMARARAMYEHSEIKYVEILFSAESFGDFLSKIDMITQVMEYDNKVLNDLKDTKKKIDDAKTELEAILVRQEENVKALEEQAASLQTALAEKQKLLDDAAKNVEIYKAIYEAAERAEDALIQNNQNALSYSANPVKYSGQGFAWPVPAAHTITSYYGYRIHPVYGYNKFHSGLDIGAGYGLDIIASADGTVTLATTNGGYGKCVIINHGSGLTTLYGHCSSLLVSSGQKVTKGQVIAKVGSTGVSTGPHLHFEVRKNGSTTNPLDYVSP